MDDRDVDRPAESEHQDEGNREGQVRGVSGLGGKVGDVAAHDHEVALAEILDVHDTPDQGEAVGDQREDRADERALDHQVDGHRRGGYQDLNVVEHRIQIGRAHV